MDNYSKANSQRESHESEWVRCPPDGDEHPVVYLSTAKDGRVRCPYCGREFTGHQKG